MGIYYGDVLGVRIVKLRETDAEYAEDYEIFWEYNGPYWANILTAKLSEWKDQDVLVQTKHETYTTYDNDTEKTASYIWLTNPPSFLKA